MARASRTFMLGVGNAERTAGDRLRLDPCRLLCGAGVVPCEGTVLFRGPRALALWGARGSTRVKRAPQNWHYSEEPDWLIKP